MVKKVEIKVAPKNALDHNFIREKARKKAGLSKSDKFEWTIERRSIDARGKHPLFVLRIALYISESIPTITSIKSQYNSVQSKQSIHIIGAGPAGYFAALKCIELGLKPILYDRGKDVRARRRDLKAIQQEGVVNNNSNYCFGEGGAGTYSDGKLYTRSYKRGKIADILQLFVDHGASSDILIDAHPHIGSNKLPAIIANMRTTIETFGGEVHFNSLLTNFTIRDGSIVNIELNREKEVNVQHVILATGHSARDVYSLLKEKNILLFYKPFSIGVRIEHPQIVIDQSQYNCKERPENLPASSYSLATQVGDRGVYSFCMCPGGLIVPAATSPGEIVVNGMSLSRRDSRYANAGTVVEIKEEDLLPFADEKELAGIALQKSVEQNMFEAGDGSQRAPAQRLTDFVNNKVSNSLPDSSYIPGLYSHNLKDLLPESIYNSLIKGVKVFDKRIKGYFSEEAVVVGTESRTSSPIRIPRDKESFMHPEITGLYPCGEGAGFAGGIISAALDGQNVVKAISKIYS